MCLDRVLGRAGEVSVAVVGGSKVADKLPMLKNLSRQVDLIAIGGNNVNAIAADPSLLDGVRGGRAEILLLDDGFGNASPSDPPLYSPRAGTGGHPLFDAGPVSLNKLAWWINKADSTFSSTTKTCNSSTMTILAPIALLRRECYVYYLFLPHGNLHCS